MNRIQIVVMVVAALALGGGGFVAGMTVGPSLAKAESSASPRPTGAAGGRLGAAGGAGGGQVFLGRQLAGQVISVGDGSITVQVQQAGSDQPRSVIALIGSTSRVVRVTETPASTADIKPGDQVLVVGQTDESTGTVTAATIVLGAGSLQQLFGGQGGGGPAASGAPGTFRRASPSPSTAP